MRLLLDVGNSRLKWGWWDHNLKPGGAVTHAGHSVEAALDAVDLRLTPSEIWAASVATPALRAILESWAMRHCNLPVRWVTSQRSACGVRNAYAQPESLGVDRWLAVIGAYHRAQGSAPCAAFVVDAGTALTLDVVDAEGRHLGGLITPGLGTQRQSLRSHTQVRAEVPNGSPEWLGRDTDTAVAWGTFHGAIGLIERVYAGICRENPDIMQIMTGGEAPLLLPYLGPAWVSAPDLVLEGLARVAVGQPTADGAA